MGVSHFKKKKKRTVPSEKKPDIIEDVVPMASLTIPWQQLKISIETGADNVCEK